MDNFSCCIEKTFSPFRAVSSSTNLQLCNPGFLTRSEYAWVTAEPNGSAQCDHGIAYHSGGGGLIHHIESEGSPDL
jgi:hypothetical protein